MPTVKMIFVQATFILTTFVHIIRIISAVTDLRSRQGQEKVKARSRQGQGKVKVKSRQGQDKARAMSIQCQGNVMGGSRQD